MLSKERPSWENLKVLGPFTIFEVVSMIVRKYLIFSVVIWHVSIIQVISYCYLGNHFLQINSSYKKSNKCNYTFLHKNICGFLKAVNIQVAVKSINRMKEEKNYLLLRNFFLYCLDIRKCNFDCFIKEAEKFIFFERSWETFL